MRRRTAFNLIELLLVLAIIAVLVAILLPVIARIRRSAQAAACAANLSQLGHAMVLYTQQHQGRLPAGFRFVQNPVNYGNSIWWAWDDALAPLLGPVSPAAQAELSGLFTTNPSPLLQCPMDDRTPPVYADGRPVGGTRSYSMTLARFMPAGRSMLGMGADGSGGYLGYVRLAEARDASATLLLVENHCNDNLAGGGALATTPQPNFQRGVVTGPGTWDRLPPAHDGAWNYLFCDGHVDRLPPEATVIRTPGMTVEEWLSHQNGMWTRETDD
jgi:prepilin-type N-terminal cleavage/methylation domain-containing protein/prepilin-type processing-associated H-X9-DG protein